MSLTPQTFAEITAALARSLDPQQLAAAVGALAPMVADTISLTSTDDTSAYERARAAFAADPSLTVSELMRATACSSTAAIAARRQALANRPANRAKAPPDAPVYPKPAQPAEAPAPAANIQIGNKPEPPTALEKAEQFLRHQLRNGPRQECHLRAAAAIAKISPAVLDKAAEDLDIRQRHSGSEPLWSLPTPMATESASSP